MRLRKKELDHRDGMGVGWGLVDLKCRRVCRRFLKKRRSGCIVEKEIYGGGGYAKSNLGNRGSWRKNAGWEYARGGVKEKL